MKASELAMTMLKWEELKRRLDDLESIIAQAVLELGKTQTVGNVRATFSKGRKRFDYKTPGEGADPLIISNNSSVLVDWRQVCKDAEIKPLVEAQGEPTVRLKLLE